MCCMKMSDFTDTDTLFLAIVLIVSYCWNNNTLPTLSKTTKVIGTKNMR